VRSGRKETAARQRPNLGWLRVSEVRFATPNPFETKRNFDAHQGCVGVCDRKLAEGEMLESNALGGEKRSRGGHCGKWLPGRFSQKFAGLRQLKTEAWIGPS